MKNTALYYSIHEMVLSMEFQLRHNNGAVNNFIGTIDTMSPTAYTMETDLFPIEVLEAYTLHNIDVQKTTPETYQHFSSLRGGGQGDYSLGMQAKIDRVVIALKTKPKSKRAVLTIPFTEHCAPCIKLEADSEWKCLRELYFRLDDDNRLHCTGIMRAQALIIVSKNIHMIGRIMENVAVELGAKMGSYTHHCIVLVEDRN